MSERSSEPVRTLAAEVRAVEEGHQARLADGTHFIVTSDTYRGVTYHVTVQAVADVVVFTCDHVLQFSPKAVVRGTHVPCKHGALCARRLEREGLLSWSEGYWRPTEKAFELGVARKLESEDETFRRL